MVSKSGLIEAIGNVHNDDRNELLGQLNEIVDELTLELSVATAVRDALAGRNVHTLTISSQDVCCCPGEPSVSVTPANGQAHARRPGRKPKAKPAATDPPAKKQIGFLVREDGKVLVAPALAAELEV